MIKEDFDMHFIDSLNEAVEMNGFIGSLSLGEESMNFFYKKYKY